MAKREKDDVRKGTSGIHDRAGRGACADDRDAGEALDRICLEWKDGIENDEEPIDEDEDEEERIHKSFIEDTQSPTYRPL